MIDPRSARSALEPIATERATRGRPVPAEQLQAAATLLADLWAAAAHHGLTPDHPGWRFHLPRAALDTITAARKQRPTAQAGR